jgi:V/A-type H+-transporting ATPase subunit I
MVRIGVWGLASDKARLVETLHELGVIHLLQPVSEPLSSEEAGTLKRVSAKLLGLIEALEWKDWPSLTDDDLETIRRRMPLSEEGILEELQKNLDEFSERLSRLQTERNELNQELQTLRRALRIAHHFDVFWKEARESGQEVTGKTRTNSSPGFAGAWRISPPTKARPTSDITKSALMKTMSFCP